MKTISEMRAEQRRDRVRDAVIFTLAALALITASTLALLSLYVIGSAVVGLL